MTCRYCWVQKVYHKTGDGGDASKINFGYKVRHPFVTCNPTLSVAKKVSDVSEVSRITRFFSLEM